MNTRSLRLPTGEVAAPEKADLSISEFLDSVKVVR